MYTYIHTCICSRPSSRPPSGRAEAEVVIINGNNSNNESNNSNNNSNNSNSSNKW